MRSSGDEGRHISPGGEESGAIPQLSTGKLSWHRSSARARAKAGLLLYQNASRHGETQR